MTCLSKVTKFSSVLIGSTALCLTSAGNAAELSNAQKIGFFDTEVKPILQENCFKCHGGKPKIKGGLRLTSRQGILEGGDSGTAYNAGKPRESLLLEMLSYADENLQMPPKGKLPQEKIDTLAKWMELGLPWNPEFVVKTIVTTEEKPSVADGKDYWAYQKPVRHDAPKVKNTAWVQNPIDAFILARLEKENLKPMAKAARLTLIRRATYDLTGLPPTRDEVLAFLNDNSGKAYERLIDRLLDSPHYGEKWGRHWLDLVRYAETNGYERDSDKPNAWRYRDYVIRSFNGDKPYDKFLLEQLAGDEFEEPTRDSIVATGYYRLGINDDEPADRELALFDDFDDVVSTTSKVMLGMTLGCARCHDHKRDPLLQADYYRLLAFIRNINPNRKNGASVQTQISRNQAEEDAHASHLREYEDQLAVVENRFLELIEKEDGKASAKSKVVRLINERGKDILGESELKLYRELRKKYENHKRNKPKGELALSVTEPRRNPPDTFILARGNPHAPGEKVTPGFPIVLGFKDPVLPDPMKNKTSRRRTILANWIISPENPVTARVMVNRIWQHHFGRAIVTTPNDFGKLGASPTHPLLLDWLATEFVSQGWKIKDMHRLIMTSSAYQMSSVDDKDALARDPANELHWRFNMRRLSAEEIRDSILAANGTLNLKSFGPSVYPPMPKAVLATSSTPGRAWGNSSAEEAARRSIYIKVKRSMLHPMMAGHDFADTDSSCAVRFSTTVPTQALTLLNSDFMQEQAGILAKRLREVAPDKRDAQVRLALELVTQRSADQKEIDRGINLIKDLEKEGVKSDEALNHFCLVALNLNEFVYLD